MCPRLEMPDHGAMNRLAAVEQNQTILPYRDANLVRLEVSPLVILERKQRHDSLGRQFVIGVGFVVDVLVGGVKDRRDGDDVIPPAAGAGDDAEGGDYLPLRLALNERYERRRDVGLAGGLRGAFAEEAAVAVDFEELRIGGDVDVLDA